MEEENLNLNEGQEGAVDSQIEQGETTVETVNADNVNLTTDKQEETKPVQSAEENAKFASLRREYEQKIVQAEQKAIDAEYSRLYGDSHGIHSKADYDKAIALQEQEEHDQSIREEYEAKGLPEDVISELVEWKKSREQSKAEQEAKQQQEKQQAEMQDFIKKYPNVKPDDIPVEVWQVNASGVPLRYAYADYANDQATKAEEIARANAENAKSSTGSVSGDGAANSSDFISYDTYEQNKSNPSWVNKNFNKIMNSRAMW